MFATLILIIIILAAAALLYWGINALTLPPTVKVVLSVILGLIMLAVIWNAVATGNVSLSLR